MHGKVVGTCHREDERRSDNCRSASTELWSPDSPALYDLDVTLKSGDSVKSYFGMRSVEARADAAGVKRIFLNNKPLFQIGPLDQGWWPDGLYTAPTDEALRCDIETLKKLGFNMARKHVKVEPARWYYWCDKLGLPGVAGHAQRDDAHASEQRPQGRGGRRDIPRRRSRQAGSAN